MDRPGDHSAVSTHSNQLLFDLRQSAWPPAHAKDGIREILVLDVEQGFSVYSAHYLKLSIRETDGDQATISADSSANDFF